MICSSSVRLASYQRSFFSLLHLDFACLRRKLPCLDFFQKHQVLLTFLLGLHFAPHVPYLATYHLVTRLYLELLFEHFHTYLCAHHRAYLPSPYLSPDCMAQPSTVGTH